MKNIGKILLVLLAAVMMILCAFGCGSKKEPTPKTETTERPAETGPYADYPKSFEVECYDPPRDFEIGVPESDSNSYFCLSCGEEYNGAQVHDSMVRRDSELFELHGINIMYHTYPSDDGVTLRTTVQNAIAANTKTHDMIGGGLNYCIIPLNSLGALYRINNAKYINFDNPWWASYFIEGVSYKGNITYASSMALGPGFFGSPYTMICNLALQERGVYLSDGREMDIFELVETGEWTLDVFYDIIHDYTTDLNNDGKIKPTDDLLAYANLRTPVTAGCHYIATGMKFSEKDDHDGVQINLTDENVINCVDRLQMIFDVIADNNFKDTPWEYQINIFINGHALFFGNSMTYVSRLTEMIADYAIIPLPKGSEDQKSYYTGINTWSSGYIAVPNQVEDNSFMGHTLELLGYYSWKTVRPIIYDRIISVRLARDPRQIAIMDTIYDTLYTDLNYIHDFVGSAGILEACIMDATQSYATKIAAVKEGIPLALEKFDREMTKASQN